MAIHVTTGFDTFGEHDLDRPVIASRRVGGGEWMCTADDGYTFSAVNEEDARIQAASYADDRAKGVAATELTVRAALAETTADLEHARDAIAAKDVELRAVRAQLAALLPPVVKG
jgi:hypothetical protein